ncbi:MAG: DUF1624 domain-containing protein [Deltaproteobacteria bacterium]|nr:DUF1624 domain-containing protein [Deltaproteobacteria bacterium]
MSGLRTVSSAVPHTPADLGGAEPANVSGERVVSAEQAAQAKAPAKAKVARWLALDLFRFLAVVLMVQGHVFYEVLSDVVRNQGWYGWHKYVHGFTAPIFLFSSGLAFGITTLGRWKEHATLGKPVLKRFERYAILIGLGYLIHLPVISLSWVLGLSPERLSALTRVDALQHIGLVLAVCEALVLALRNKGPYLAVIGILLVLGVGTAPWVWNIDISALPIPIGAWVNDHTSSIFPIVPWCGFILCGVLTASFVERRRGKVESNLKELALPIAAIGLVALGAGMALRDGHVDPFPEHNFWKTSPWFFLIRAGWIFIVLAILCAIDVGIARARQRRAEKRAPRESSPGEAPKNGKVIRFIQVVGQQTLVIYVAHLFLIYGVGFLPGVRRWVHRDLDLLGSIGVVSVFFVLMAALAWAWNWTKKNHLKTFDRVRYAITALILIAFFVR